MVKYQKRILLCARLSEEELSEHHRICASLRMKSQDFLYTQLMNHWPESDPRCEMIYELQPLVGRANDLTWKIKRFLEKDEVKKDGKVDREAAFWTFGTCCLFVSRLEEALAPLPQKLSRITEADPQHHIIDEEHRTTSSPKLTKRLVVRVTEEEKDLIACNADSCLLSVSTYIRLLATGKYPQNREVFAAGKVIAKITGDFGRIMGIMRYFLTLKEHIYLKLPKETKLKVIGNCRTAIACKQISGKILHSIARM